MYSNMKARFSSSLALAVALLFVSLVSGRPAAAAKGGNGGGGSTGGGKTTTTTAATNPLAGQPGAKIFAQQEGWYQVSRQNLIDSGWDPGTSETYIQLWSEGTQQAILVNDGGDGSFDSSDTIEFYGTGLDTTSTATRVYWLVQGSSPGLRISTQSNPRGKIGSAPASFDSTVTFNPKKYYAPGIPSGSPDGFYGDAVTATPVSETLTAVDPASSTASATLSVAIEGAYWWSHNVNVQLNGNLAGTMNFNGETSQTSSFSVPSSWVVSGPNSVTLTAPDGGNDVSLITSISLTYPRLLKASNDSLELTAAGSVALSVDGFSSSLIRAFDVTTPATPQQLVVAISAGGGGYSAKLTTPSSTGNRKVLAIATDQILSPAGIVPNVPSNLSGSANQANFVIVAYPSMMSAASSLADLRQQQGMQVSVVSVTDVYDEFNYGEKDPSAIKNFLQYTQTKWGTAPRYVLLLGGASYDPRNYLGYGDLDLVPTEFIATALNRTSSDDWFVDFNNDGLPDMAIGRIPVDTPDQAATVISKITGYGQTTGAWTKSILMAVDANDSSDDFESASANVASLVPSGYSTQSVLTGQIGGSAARTAVLDGFNAGQLIVNYTGHGFEQSWSGSNILTVNDPPSLSNASELPFVVSTSCLVGYFQDPSTISLAASILSAPNAGVAVWGSSALTSLPGETAMNQSLFSYLFNGTHPALGDAVAQAKAATTDQDVRKSYIFFGDPTMKLAQ